MPKAQTVIEAAGREVVITNPDKIFFPATGYTKLDLAKYYAAVADGALRGIAARPFVLKRYVNGADHEPFFQKRAPENHPDWIETVELRFPSGRTAHEIVIRTPAQLLWVVNLGCIDLNPHPVRADDLDHPDELRVDLDPGPGVSFDDVRRVALIVRDVLDENALVGWPKTSGSRGIHVNVRVERRWTFDQVRRGALAVAREVERRAPEIATSKWWKEERHGVFLDYNQNAKDRTVASAWSVRPTPGLRSSGLHARHGTETFRKARRCVRRHRCSSRLVDEAARAVSEAGKGRTRRRSLASELQETKRRASARGAVAAEATADHRRESAAQRRCARGTRALEEATSEGRREAGGG